MEDPEQAVRTLNRLIELGVKLSIDDFGTGYSSLSYLKRFPLHELKIDRSFLNDMTDDPEDCALISAIIYLAHEFKLKVVAEGVEQQGQLDILASLNCDEYQGYFFSRPVTVQDLMPMLSEHPSCVVA
jgi:EAL domain-containing protein (putative c-di-GMP-specific phosphodiesterase class I)